MASSLPPLPSLSAATPDTCALDLFKLATAQHISTVLNIPLAQAYDGVESGKAGKGVTGDFTVALPRFRLKGDAKAMAAKIVSEVRWCVEQDGAGGS
mgnify:FL=1